MGTICVKGVGRAMWEAMERHQSKPVVWTKMKEL